MDDVVAKVRELHQPRWYHADRTLANPEPQAWPVCRGCDEGSHAESPPEWPCRTAELVYTAEEIAAREPQVPECPENHRTYGEGAPVRARAVFTVAADGSLQQRRWKCEHVPPVPVTAFDPAWV